MFVFILVYGAVFYESSVIRLSKKFIHARRDVMKGGQSFIFHPQVAASLLRVCLFERSI